MSSSSFSSILSNTIIPVKYVNSSAWRQKSQFAGELTKSDNKKSHSTGSTMELNRTTQEIECNFNQRYPGNYVIDTYA